MHHNYLRNRPTLEYKVKTVNDLLYTRRFITIGAFYEYKTRWKDAQVVTYDCIKNVKIKIRK